MPVKCSTRRSYKSVHWQFAKEMCAHQAAHGQILLAELPIRAPDLGWYSVRHRGYIFCRIRPRSQDLLACDEKDVYGLLTRQDPAADSLSMAVDLKAVRLHLRNYSAIQRLIPIISQSRSWLPGAAECAHGRCSHDRCAAPKRLFAHKISHLEEVRSGCNDLMRLTHCVLRGRCW